MSEDEFMSDLIDLSYKYTYGDKEAATYIAQEICDYLIANDFVIMIHGEVQRERAT